MLPSTRVASVYIGPSGEIRAQDAPAVPEVSSDEEEDTDTVWAGSPIAAARRWRKYNAARKAREDASPAPFETAALVTARMKAASRNAQQGISKTRTAENAEQLLVSKLAGKLAAMRLAANRLAGPCIVHALDFQVQEEVLTLLSLEAAAAAAQVCTVWHELLTWRNHVFKMLTETNQSSPDIKQALLVCGQHEESWTLIKFR